MTSSEARVLSAQGRDAAALSVVSHLAQAEAAMMLLESLMILLMERGLLSKEELIETVEAAVETKRRLVAEHEHAGISAAAAGVLSNLGNSLAASTPGSPSRIAESYPMTDASKP